MRNNEIFFDGLDAELIRSLMEEYGDSKFPFYGTNEDGEEVEIHIAKTSVVHKTFQKNGWVRVNYYDEYGYPEGEMFEGRWK